MKFISKEISTSIPAVGEVVNIQITNDNYKLDKLNKVQTFLNPDPTYNGTKSFNRPKYIT